ncbi:hypothetical protein BLS_002031, partial [Venturia inaequalis]
MTPISKPIATGSISSKTIASLQKELHTTKTELETVKTGLETSTKTDTKAIVTDGRRLVRLAVEYACDQTDYNANAGMKEMQSAIVESINTAVGKHGKFFKEMEAMA